MSARRVERRTLRSRGGRRLARAIGATAVAVLAGAIGGVAFAFAVLVAGALLWGMVRWPCWEERVFEPAESALVRPEVVARPIVERGLSADGHRAFARALHAVSAAYLAECEQEAER